MHTVIWLYSWAYICCLLATPCSKVKDNYLSITDYLSVMQPDPCSLSKCCLLYYQPTEKKWTLPHTLDSESPRQISLLDTVASIIQELTFYATSWVQSKHSDQSAHLGSAHITSHSGYFALCGSKKWSTWLLTLLHHNQYHQIISLGV